MINSKKKGSKNERDISKLFASWSGYEFARTPQSGGIHWKKKNTTGDIVCIDERHGYKFPFSIEAKFHSEVDFSHLLDGSKGKNTNKINDFWEQAVRDSKVVSKIPMLFVRKNGMKSDMHFVALPSSFFLLVLMDIEINNFDHGVMHYDNGANLRITIINSADLFKIEYKYLYKKAKNYLKDASKL